MLQVRFRFGDDIRNRFYPTAQIRDAFFGRIEIARDQKVKTIGETLVVNEGVPLRFAQFLQLENLVIDILTQNPNIDLIGTGELLVIVEFLERAVHLLRLREHSRTCLRRVIAQDAIKSMIAQFGCELRMGRKIILDVILRDFFKLTVFRIRENSKDRQRQCACDGDDLFHVALSSACRHEGSARWRLHPASAAIADKSALCRSKRQ